MSEHDESSEDLVELAAHIDAKAEQICDELLNSDDGNHTASILANALAKLWAKLGWDRDDLTDFIDESYCGYAGIDDDIEQLDRETDAALRDIEVPKPSDAGVN